MNGNHRQASRRGRAPLRNGVVRRPLHSVLLLALIVGVGRAAPAPETGRGLIYGTLYTAEHPDSIAVTTGIMLIYRDSNGEKHRTETQTDAHGRFSFPGLPVYEKSSYVLRVQGKDNPYLSSPLHFESGQERLLFNFVVPGSLPVNAAVSRAVVRPPSAAARPKEDQASTSTEPTTEWLFLFRVLGACAVLGCVVWVWRSRARRRALGSGPSSVAGHAVEPAVTSLRPAADDDAPRRRGRR